MATEVALGESNPISPTTITDSIAYLVSLIILLIAFTAWYMIKARQAPDAHDLLAQQARHALGELQMGGNFRSIILRCYAEMERILAQQRGVKRKPGMTVREFELRLVGLGFPEKPVQQLIYLFEGVRYGDKDPGVEGEAEAVACLEMIARSVEVQA
ncbi:MAG: DUF4129 domain-containing protein [Anaerolineales bacterium]|nr:DUF4129 domain-containing protein [Anaerolineales bacterium]